MFTFLFTTPPYIYMYMCMYVCWMEFRFLSLTSSWEFASRYLNGISIVYCCDGRRQLALPFLFHGLFFSPSHLLPAQLQRSILCFVFCTPAVHLCRYHAPGEPQSGTHSSKRLHGKAYIRFFTILATASATVESR